MRFRISVIATAVILATGLGFCVGRIIGLGNTVILTATPSRATGKDAFIEDGDGTAHDNQENILAATAPGMVHVLSCGTSVGIGLVLTDSATLVTSAQASRESSCHVPGQVYDTAIGTTGRQDALTLDVGTLAALDTTVSVGRTTRSGLLASVLQSAQT